MVNETSFPYTIDEPLLRISPMQRRCLNSERKELYDIRVLVQLLTKPNNSGICELGCAPRVAL